MKYHLLVIFGITALVLLSGCTVQQPSNGNSGNGTDITAEVVEVDDTVKVEYEGRFESGEVFDSSARHGKPLEFVAGIGRVIRGFDEAVVGMRLGEEKTVTIPPVKAYGFRDKSKIVEIPKENFGDSWDSLEVGVPVHSSQGANGTVLELKEDSAIVDFNHHLAGKTLIFWIKVIYIKKE